MIYLIEIDNHNIQHNGDGCADSLIRNKFSIFLEDKIKKYDISLVAEEFNKDALEMSRADVATVENVVEKLKSEGLKIEHRFCELSLNDRKSRNILSESEIYRNKLNIHSYLGEKPDLNRDQQKIFDEEMKKSFLARESAWFEKIRDHLNNNILFICGTDHVISFGSLLMDAGYKTKKQIYK